MKEGTVVRVERQGTGQLWLPDVEEMKRQAATEVLRGATYAFICERSPEAPGEPHGRLYIFVVCNPDATTPVLEGFSPFKAEASIDGCAVYTPRFGIEGRSGIDFAAQLMAELERLAT